MDKNQMDKLNTYVRIVTLAIVVFVSIYGLKLLSDIIYDQGVMGEKIGTLEELVPLVKG